MRRGWCQSTRLSEPRKSKETQAFFCEPQASADLASLLLSAPDNGPRRRLCSLCSISRPASRWSSTSRPAARPQIRPRTSRASAKTSCWARRGSRISSRSKISTSISPRCARAACPCLNPSSAAGFTHEAARRRSSCSVPVAFGAAPTRRVAYCQPVLVVCSRSAAVGRTARRLAVGNARYLPHFLQNALLVASISLYKLTS